MKKNRITYHASRITATTAQSGRSMIEMLGVLIIMGLITAAAVSMIGSAMRNQKRSTTQDEVLQIVSGVRQVLGGYDDYSGLDPRTIFAAIQMPTRNPYNGKYELSVDPQNPRRFILSIGGLSTSDCLFFVSRAWVDSADYVLSSGRMSGAVAEPSDCNAPSNQNMVRIAYE